MAFMARGASVAAMAAPDGPERASGAPALGPMRRDYDVGRLDEEGLAATWLDQMRAWMDDAIEAGLPEPNAMVLATADSTGAPSARTVLLKALDERGLAFFTNLRSRKGTELAENPRASAVFPWHAMQRQVVVAGTVERVSDPEADDYFTSRPLGSRLAALASPQSDLIESRGALERRHAELARQVGDHPQRPEWWGGLRIAPVTVEFWQGRPDRLHDRLRFRAAEGGWVVERLAP